MLKKFFGAFVAVLAFGPAAAMAAEPTYTSPFSDVFEQIPIVAISSDVALYAAAALAIPLTFAGIKLGIRLIGRGTSSA